MSTRSSARRQALLDAAATLFARFGFDKTSIDDIARQARVSKGAVYLEFRSKDALFEALLRRELERYTAEWLARFRRDPGEWSFARMFQHSQAAIHANPFMRALYTRDQRILGGFLRKDSELLQLNLTSTKDLFAQLQKAGAIRDDLPAPTLAYLLNVFSFGFLMAGEIIPSEDTPPFEEAMTAFAQFLDRGLSPSGRVNRKAGREIVLQLVERMQGTIDKSLK
jgi:AcrR family transcriptional regulator